MVTDRAVDVREVGGTFAELVQDDQAVTGVWVRKHRDVFEIWALTEPIDPDHERSLLGNVGTLHDTFPHALIRVRLLNPAYFEGGEQEAIVAEELPEGAERIYSRRE